MIIIFLLNSQTIQLAYIRLIKLLNDFPGDHMLRGLKDLCKTYPDYVHSARGLGTYCAFDLYGTEMRDKVAIELRNAGIQCGGSGMQTVRLRPGLTFTPKHADIFLDKLNKVLARMKSDN